ncbi:hypothetical protein BpHYR1_005299 [Brachionus plicatilis]|uniref:Uncharacterized protein n=1 Tax=Brachionus plicatilis TaxID=10195 RepID=A0A3M7S687_BRAPC|nr:hypothetical protein BpHYR1_005299 [Brachionus plicatilis]
MILKKKSQFFKLTTLKLNRLHYTKKFSTVLRQFFSQVMSSYSTNTAEKLILLVLNIMKFNDTVILSLGTFLGRILNIFEMGKTTAYCD